MTIATPLRDAELDMLRRLDGEPPCDTVRLSHKVQEYAGRAVHEIICLRDEAREVRRLLETNAFATPGAPLVDQAARMAARLRHDHDEKCSVVAENLRVARRDLAALRASELTDDEREALRALRDEAVHDNHGVRLAVLDKLLGDSHGHA